MTLVANGEEAYKILIGDDTFIDQKGVWLPCKSGPSFTNPTPILMHYDSESGVTSLLGQAYLKTPSTYSLDEDIFVLPNGYHFTGIDQAFPFGWGGSLTTYGAYLSLSSNTTVHAKHYLGTGSDSYLRAYQVCFGNVTPSVISNSKVWTTTTIAPD